MAAFTGDDTVVQQPTSTQRSWQTVFMAAITGDYTLVLQPTSTQRSWQTVFMAAITGDDTVVYSQQVPRGPGKQFLYYLFI